MLLMYNVFLGLVMLEWDFILGRQGAGACHLLPHAARPQQRSYLWPSMLATCLGHDDLCSETDSEALVWLVSGA